MSSIPPVRAVDPVPGRLAHRGAGTLVIVVGFVLVVVGLGVWAWPAVVAAGGICAAVPCDPVVPVVGFRAAPDGGVIAETGPRTAAQMTGLTVHARGRATDPDDAEPPVLWRIERVGATAPGWDGEVELGTVPQGFVETVPPAPRWRERAADVWVDDGCYFGSGALPYGTLRPDEVVADGDDVETPSEFRADDEGFSTCTDGALPGTDRRGLGLSLAGAGLVVTGLALRGRR